VVLGAYLAWTAAFLLRGHSFWAFVHVGSRYASRAAPASPIRAGLDDRSVTDIGYDGQFVYYIAVDPLRARCCLDAPAYRYTRVLYPLAARAVALGSTRLVPVAMVAINLAAIAATVALLAAWLRRHGRSAWWALIYGFYPGLFQAFQTDVTEASAYALVAAAIYVLELGGRRRVLWAAILFGLAGLTRETTLLFPAVYALAVAARRPGPGRRALGEGLTLAVLAAGPLLLYKAFLAATLGSLGVGFGSGSEIATAPLAGLLSFRPLEAREWVEVAGEVVPATLVAILALYRVLRGQPRVELAAYLVNYAVLVLLLQRSSYFSYFDSGRIQTGVVLAAVVALPTLLGRSSTRDARVGAQSLAAAIVVPACLLWLGVALPGLLAPHAFHVFKP
jgi:Glycosyltransferase family 87